MLHIKKSYYVFILLSLLIIFVYILSIGQNQSADTEESVTENAQSFGNSYEFDVPTELTTYYLNDSISTVNKNVILQLKDNRINISGEGEKYDWVMSFLDAAKGWENMTPFCVDGACCKNYYVTDNYMIHFLSEDMIVLTHNMMTSAGVRFVRVDPNYN